MTMLSELPLVSQVTKYLDGCSCARASKEEVAAIKAELDQKDSAIERLEMEIRQKDLEKDNLMTMQKVLQEQISQIRADLEAQSEEQQSMVSEVTPYNARPAAAAKPPATAAAKGAPEPELGGTPRSRSAAVTRMQARQRGKLERRQTQEKVERGDMAGQKRELAAQQELAAQRMQARARGAADRSAVETRKAAGDLPGQPRLAAEQADEGEGGGEAGDFEGEEESVDSDYDYDDSAFVGLGEELLSGPLKLAKVYGQEEPPAAENELEWELRYFMLHAVRTHVSSKYGGNTVPWCWQHRAVAAARST